MLKDLVKKCRSYRRFFQEVSIPYEDLKDMVDTARLTGCTKNLLAKRKRPNFLLLT